MIKPHELISYLFTFGKLVLPGIGTLHLDQSPAKSAFHEFRIYGPKIRYRIIPSSEAELSNYKNWLKALLQCDEITAEKFFGEQTDQFYTSLQEKAEIIIPALGRIYIGEKELVHFEVDKDLQRSLEFAFPDLPLHYYPGKEPVTGIQQKAPARTSAAPRKTGIPWYVLLSGMIIAALLLAFCISYFAGFNGFAKSESSQTTIAEMGEQDVESMENSILEEELVFQDTVTAIDDFDGNTDQQAQTETEQPPVKPKKTTAQQKPFTEPIPEAIKARLEQLDSDLTELSSPLLIVTGSFKKASQANKMLQTIESKGYHGFVTKFGDYYRTGVLIDIPEEKTDSVLSEVKSQIEKDAWILTD